MAPPQQQSSRPLLIGAALTSDGNSSSRDGEARLFYHNFSWRHLMPRTSSGLPAEDERLHRKKLWEKHGQSMHFLTLEFKDDATEMEFVKDSVRRTKRWVQYAVLALCLFNVALASMRWIDSIGHVDSGAGDPIAAAILYFLQHLQTRLDKYFVQRNLQPLLFFWSLLQITSTLAFSCYIAPEEYRAVAARSGIGSHGLFVQDSVISVVIATLIACRLRYFYFLVFTSYSFLGFYFSVPLDGVNISHMLLMCCGMVFLSYTMEVLQRKDFVQAAVVWKESHRSDLLLRNILPEPIVKALKAAGGQHANAHSYDKVTVFFADVVSFTTMSAQVSAPMLVKLLNRMFRTFDDLADKNTVEKIKTIGDCYMAAAGLPLVNPNHAKSVARFALQMLEVVAGGAFKNPATGEAIRVRAGMHSGPCVAGVIGHRKFAYDIWGDAVNTASRMESHGEPMRLHCSDDSFEELQDDFACEARVPMKVKGKGMMQTYFVLEERPSAKCKSFLCSEMSIGHVASDIDGITTASHSVDDVGHADVERW